MFYLLLGLSLGLPEQAMGWLPLGFWIGSTVNREYFDVKIFSDSMACAKIKRTKNMRNINDNAVQGRLSENYLTRKIIA